MKASKIYLLAATFLVAGFSANAEDEAGLSVKGNLPVIYSGSGVPSSSEWSEAKLVSTVNSSAAVMDAPASSEGVLKIKGGAEDKFSQMAWYKTDLEMDGKDGFSVEARIKVVAAKNDKAFTLQGYNKEGIGFRVAITETAVLETTNPFLAPTVIKNELDNTADFNVFRVAVEADGTASVFRNAELLGTFEISKYHFDNLFDDGGFEGEELSKNWTVSRGTATMNKEIKMTGEQSLFIDNGINAENPSADADLQMTYPIFPLKANTTYDMSYDFKREEVADDENNWWRDFIFDNQGYADRDGRIWKENARTYKEWQIRSNSFNSGTDKSLLYFCQLSDRGHTNKVSFDNIYAAERMAQIGPNVKAPSLSEAQPTEKPEGTNLFINGDFEDVTKGNDGEAYDWALASHSANPGGDNYPVKWSDAWGAYVRLQDVAKGTDTGEKFAHAGSYALRFSYLNEVDGYPAKFATDIKAEAYKDKDGVVMDYNLTADIEAHGNPTLQNMNYRQELEANKTYTLSFWYKGANYGDKGKFFVGVGDFKVWGTEFDQTYAADWTYQTVTFTTTERNKTLRLFTELSNWYNFYLDDIELYEVEYQPSDAPSFFLFGKATSLDAVEVEIDYVGFDATGAFATDVTTSIDEVAPEASIYAFAEGNVLNVVGAEGAVISVFNIAGQLITETTDTAIALPAKGVYVVKVGNNVLKVLN